LIDSAESSQWLMAVGGLKIEKKGSDGGIKMYFA
jgi:hypothetical protein